MIDAIGQTDPRPPVAPGRPDGRGVARPGARLSTPALAVLGAVVGLVVIFATDQVLPATSAHQADLRVWLGARAAGFMALILLTFQVVVGLLLSHPTNKSTWRLSGLIFPWHENAWVFTVTFVTVHVVAIITDQYANVGLVGSFIPGMSAYRSVPVALGTFALYGVLITGLTARFTRLVPEGWWLKLHRLSLGVLVLGWTHGLLAGTDSPASGAIYAATFAAVAVAATYRYWIVRSARPTFASSLQPVPEESRR
jgi:DMSO/TMAO reductase YedYZ heme-binding membrane subunit